MAGQPTWCRVVILGPSQSQRATFIIGGTGLPDLGVVDVLARWHLRARRRGGRVVVTEMTAELAELLELVGLLGQLGG